MYVVMTRVKLRPGTSERCAELFRQTNRDVFDGQTDWLGAQMIFDSETNIVTALATWRDAESYTKMSAGKKFKTTMENFSQLFETEPEVSINRVLVEMAR